MHNLQEANGREPLPDGDPSHGGTCQWRSYSAEGVVSDGSEPSRLHPYDNPFFAFSCGF